MNTKKTFEVDKTIIFDNKKTIVLPASKWCCEKFYEYVHLDKIHFDKPDRHSNEYPYVELLTLEEDAAPPEEKRSSTLTYLHYCMFCGYQFSATGKEQTLYKHNQYFCK